MLQKPALYFNIIIFISVVLLISSCGSGFQLDEVTSGDPGPIPLVVISTITASPLPAITVSPTQEAEITKTTTGTATQTSTPTVTSTPDPYEEYTIDYLSSRNYGGGSVEIVETLAVNSYFTRTLIAYPSDGLTIYGFMNMPTGGTPPYPVIVASHGYIDPEIYSTLDYTTRYADALARAGFLVLHPNLRGFPPSDDGDNLFRVGLAIDVLNLIALVQQQAGNPGPLELADPDAIGVWGHSMGGGVSTKVITINPDVRAAVLYGPMGADDQKNFERILNYFSNGERGMEELSAPAEAFQRISPLYYLDRVQAAVSLHHGENDIDVPLVWSMDLCSRLEEMGKPVECYTYPEQPHTFRGEGDQLYIQRMIDFYDQWLR